MMGYKSKNAAYQIIKDLIEEGFVSKDSSGRLSPTKMFLGTELFYSIKAGFTTPVEESAGDKITLDEYLISHPSSTIMISVSGDSMTEAGIFDGDIVIVEKGSSYKLGDIVVAEIDEGYTLKFLDKENNRYFLRPGNIKYPNIYPEDELKIFGVVTGVVRKIKK